LGAELGHFSLIRNSFEEDPAMGPALSRILLEEVAAGKRGPTARVARTGDAVAFGRRDCVSPGYGMARRVGTEMGYAGIERLSGGRATAYGEGVVVLTLTVPDPFPARGTGERFRFAAELARDALLRLGVDARIGEIPGEYCPGEFSVSASGRSKLAGIGQRMVKGAAHVGIVITASGGDRLASVLEPVYRALELPLDPATIGSVEAETGKCTSADLIDALVKSLGKRADLESDEIGPGTLAQAESVAHRFRSLP